MTIREVELRGVRIILRIGLGVSPSPASDGRWAHAGSLLLRWGGRWQGHVMDGRPKVAVYGGGRAITIPLPWWERYRPEAQWRKAEVQS